MTWLWRFLYFSDSNIELNKMNNEGSTAFMLACVNGHKDVVKLLLEHCTLIQTLKRIKPIGLYQLMLFRCFYISWCFFVNENLRKSSKVSSTRASKASYDCILIDIWKFAPKYISYSRICKYQTNNSWKFVDILAKQYIRTYLPSIWRILESANQTCVELRV